MTEHGDILHDGLRRFVLHNARRFTESETSSGLKVLVKEVDSIPGVNCSLWYRAGGAHSPPGRSGIAHFLEHMVFKGTESFEKGDVDRICDRNGGSNNAYTELDFTCYVYNFASDRWKIALDLLASQMNECLIPADEFESERQVVIQERKISEDDPSFKLEEAALLAALPESPYRFGVIGTLEDLEQVDRDDMVDFYRRYYRPDNAVLVLSGELRTESALDLVEEKFGRLKQDGPLIVDEPDPGNSDSSQQSELRFEMSLPAQLPELKIHYRIPAMGHPDTFPLMILNNILSYGKSSRLYRRLIERKQLATEAYFSSTPCRLPFVADIYAQARPGVSLEVLEQSLMEEIDLIASESVTAEEIGKAKRQIRTNLLLGSQSLEDQSYILGKAIMSGGLAFLENFFRNIELVDANMIRETAQRRLCPEHRTVAHLLPAVGHQPGGGTE